MTINRIEVLEKTMKLQMVLLQLQFGWNKSTVIALKLSAKMMENHENFSLDNFSQSLENLHRELEFLEADTEEVK